MTRFRAFWCAWLGLAWAVLPLTTPASATPVETVLHQFTSGTDGSLPQWALIRDDHGVLYGTTHDGGTGGDCGGLVVLTGCGIAFSLTPPATAGAAWTKTVLYRFKPNAGGELPGGGLTFDGSGGLYGVTFTDGTTAAGGTVFHLTPPKAVGQTLWTETVLYHFAGGQDGEYPSGEVVIGAGGVLYGTTVNGGGTATCPGFPASCGVVFKLAPPSGTKAGWTETVLHRFAGGKDGGSPSGALVVGAKGELYGTTLDGGDGPACKAGDCGTVFRLAPPAKAAGSWTETVLHRFTDGSGGANPWTGLAIDKKGVLYGVTSAGGRNVARLGTCGVVFSLTPPIGTQTAWAETVLHDFTGADGCSPFFGALTLDGTGALYGTTSEGGLTDTCNCGTVIKLTPPASAKLGWSATVLHAFTGGVDGNLPNGRLVLGGGMVFGTALYGGRDADCNKAGCGVVFQLSQ